MYLVSHIAVITCWLIESCFDLREDAPCGLYGFFCTSALHDKGSHSCRAAEGCAESFDREK